MLGRAQNKEGFAALYEAEFERVYDWLIEVARAETSWQRGLRKALDALARGIVERPLLARSLVIDVHRAGDRTLAKRNEILERLSGDIDGARLEPDSPHDPPPGMTAPFMIGAIESSLARALDEGRPEMFAAAVPALTDLVAVAYLGEPAIHRMRPQAAIDVATD